MIFNQLHLALHYLLFNIRHSNLLHPSSFVGFLFFSNFTNLFRNRDYFVSYSLLSNFIPQGVLLAFLLYCNGLASQTILIQPYLQNATPQSVVIMWETDIENESVVRYGTTPDLGTSVSGTSITTLGNKITFSHRSTNSISRFISGKKVRKQNGVQSTPDHFSAQQLDRFCACL